jgi:hypothetical protein
VEVRHLEAGGAVAFVDCDGFRWVGREGGWESEVDNVTSLAAVTGTVVGTASWMSGGGGVCSHSFRSWSWKGEEGLRKRITGFGGGVYVSCGRGLEWESPKWYLYGRDMARSYICAIQGPESLRRQVGT